MQTVSRKPSERPHQSVIAALLEAVDRCDVVDLSQDMARERPDGPFRTRIDVLEAEPGARFLTEKLMPIHFPAGVGKISADSFPDRRFLRHETVTASTHAGSHVDAPGHYGGALGAGAFVNDAPLRAFIAEGVMIDGTSCQGEEVTWSHVEQTLAEARVDVLANKIVLIRALDRKAVSVRVVEELLDRGVTVIGTDNDSFDGSFRRMLENYLETADSRCLWPCHMLGRTRPYYQLENLAHLERLPVTGFLVWAPPVLVGGATAAWSRVLALVPRKKGGA